jgi:transglutaminase-like putative cysteine protease
MPATSLPQLKVLLSALLLYLISNSAFAENPTVHISAKPTWVSIFKPYDKQVPARKVENGYFYQLIEEQEHIENKADYHHIIKQIVSATGIQNSSEISVGFDPSYERLDFHQIIIWRDGKPQNRLSANAFKIIADEKELSKFIYQGTYSAYCILSDIRKGDKIEYSYTITGRNPIMAGKFCKNIYLQQAQPVAHIYKSLIASPSRKLNFKSFNKPPKMVQSAKNGLTCYAWEDFQVPVARDYNTQPDWSTNYNYVQISDFDNWNEVARWALNINPTATSFTGALAKQIALFKAEAGSNKEKYFRAAVKLVQDEVRYMGIEMGEYSHRANRPENIYNQRYGDCKDKSLLLVSILNAGGIPANLVLINSEAKGKTDIYLPSAYAFDHATVVATVNRKQVWVDPTISYQRGSGLNIYYPPYQKGLILAPQTTALTNIPPSEMGVMECRENYTISKDSNKVTLDVITRYTLNEADKTRGTLASTGVAETEQNYLSYYQKVYPKIESTDSVTIKDNETDNEITTIEHYTISDFFKDDTVSGKKQASFYADYISEQLTDINTKLRYPRMLNYPCAIDFTTQIVLPGGWNVDDSNTDIIRDGYAFKAKTWAMNDTLYLNYKFNYLSNFLPVDKLDEYAADVKQIKNVELGYTFSYAPNGASTFKLNYWMVLAVVIFVLIIGGLAFKIYHTETPEILFEPGATFMPLGGWPIFIAIGLGFTATAIFISLAEGTYFNLARWDAHIANTNRNAFRVFFTFEVLGNTFLLCYSIFCLILLLNKRDILPRYIIGFYLAGLAFFILEFVFSDIVLKKTSTEAVSPVIRAVIASAIWIPYFMRSERVAQTFIVPYPASNYRYEEMERKQTV